MKLLGPFDAVAGWLGDVLPARMRGLTPVALADIGVATGGRRVQLVLPEASLLVHGIDLPTGPLSEARLASLISAKCDEFSPWDHGEYLWDVVRVDGGLTLALTPLKPVREAEKVLADQGRGVAEVVGTVAPRAMFRFRGDEVARKRWRNRLALVFGLVLAACAAAIGFGAMMTLAAQDRMTTANAALERFSAKEAATTGLERDATALIGRKTPEQSLAIQMDHLAQALPDESWLETLTISATGFELAGRSTNPEAIIPALEADPTFSQVDFAGSSAHDVDTGEFTFSIQGKIAP